MKYLNEEIINLSKKLGFELIGFGELKYLKELEKILDKQEKLGYKTPFQKGNISSKIFEKSIYKSVIALGLTYNKYNPKLKENEAHFSSVSVGKDYHEVIKEKLEFIKLYIKDIGFNSEIFVDNNIYDERYLAYISGLGFYGKNGMLINEKYGSFFFIGVLLTDAPFKYNKMLDKTCIECDECIRHCPTGAINETGILNGNKCLSYLTQKKELTKEEEKYINSCIYGCDICQIVCPHNISIPKSDNFKPEGIELIEIEKFLKMEEGEYKTKYKNSSSFWRGKKVIDRNITLYSENKLKK